MKEHIKTIKIVDSDFTISVISDLRSGAILLSVTDGSIFIEALVSKEFLEALQDACFSASLDIKDTSEEREKKDSCSLIDGFHGSIEKLVQEHVNHRTIFNKEMFDEDLEIQLKRSKFQIDKLTESLDELREINTKLVTELENLKNEVLDSTYTLDSPSFSRVLQERNKCIKEGKTVETDLKYNTSFELSRAAAYCLDFDGHLENRNLYPSTWPKSFKRRVDSSTLYGRLIYAAQLVHAEIDRLIAKGEDK